MSNTARAVLALLVFAGTACASEADENAGTSPESTVTPPGAAVTPTTAVEDGVPDAARAYFQAFASGDLSQMGTMLDSSVEGSPAGLYATHQIALRRSLGPAGSTTADIGGDAVVLTERGLDQNGAEVEQSTTYDAFTVDGDKLAGFDVDGVPVADRIRAGDTAGTSGDGVTVRAATAYQTARGDLALNVDITNGRTGVVDVADYDWSLVTGDGRQVAPSERWLAPAPSVEPGATAGHGVLFEQVGLGGTMRFVAFADDFRTEIRFDVAVPG